MFLSSLKIAVGIDEWPCSSIQFWSVSYLLLRYLTEFFSNIPAKLFQDDRVFWLHPSFAISSSKIIEHLIGATFEKLLFPHVLPVNSFPTQIFNPLKKVFLVFIKTDSELLDPHGVLTCDYSPFKVSTVSM